MEMYEALPRLGLVKIKKNHLVIQSGTANDNESQKKCLFEIKDRPIRTNNMINFFGIKNQLKAEQWPKKNNHI